MTRAVLLAAALSCASVSAQALTPVAQDRHVFVSHDFTPTGPDSSELLSAADFGPFSAGVDGVAVPGISPISFSYLTSRIEAERLQASGYSVAYPQTLPTGHDVVANSVYSVDFVLDEARGFTLTGQLDHNRRSCSTAADRIQLIGPGGVVAGIDTTMPAWSCTGDQCVFSLPLAASGELAPGSYSLVVRSDSTARGVIGPHGGCSGFSDGTYSAELLLAPLVPALPLPLAPLLGVALLATARAMRRPR